MVNYLVTLWHSLFRKEQSVLHHPNHQSNREGRRALELKPLRDSDWQLPRFSKGTAVCTQ